MVLFHPPDAIIAENHAPPQRIICSQRHSRLKARFSPGGRADSTPLIALHGISRNARAVWDAFAPLAQAEGKSLLVPRFDQATWPQFQQIGKARPDLALLNLIRQSGLDGQKLDVFGFSGGAQLAHRFAMLYPHRVACLHLAAPGWYCLPKIEVHWPQGLGRAAGQPLRKFDAAVLSRLQLSAYLALPLRLWVGGEDVQRDESLRQSPEIDAQQGLTRVDRAQCYANTFARAAHARGLVPDIEITVLPGCGHDFTQCAQVGGLAARVLQSTPNKTIHHTPDKQDT